MSEHLDPARVQFPPLFEDDEQDDDASDEQANAELDARATRIIDPLRIGQSPLAPGTPAPGLWVAEIHGYDDGVLDTHSVSFHADRAAAVRWCEGVMQDVRAMYADEDPPDRPEFDESHLQDGDPADWRSEWTATWPGLEDEPYLVCVVTQARFGYAYTAF